MTAHLKLVAITPDCEDPGALAEFYRQVTGAELHPQSHNDFAGLIGVGGLFMGFQRVDRYRRPQWPDQTVPQQIHLDFEVEDLDQMEAILLRLGATSPEHQPAGERARVLVDPAGHPFCLTLD
ncbi:VOC family protein [Nocardia tengchongensis]|uniref:VOC family protein n=1 Tax=Nocardia tengchongensis TaxID=2055889 RepID=UPI003649A4A8